MICVRVILLAKDSSKVAGIYLYVHETAPLATVGFGQIS